MSHIAQQEKGIAQAKACEAVVLARGVAYGNY